MDDSFFTDPIPGTIALDEFTDTLWVKKNDGTWVEIGAGGGGAVILAGFFLSTTQTFSAYDGTNLVDLDLIEFDTGLNAVYANLDASGFIELWANGMYRIWGHGSKSQQFGAGATCAVELYHNSGTTPDYNNDTHIATGRIPSNDGENDNNGRMVLPTIVRALADGDRLWMRYDWTDSGSSNRQLEGGDPTTPAYEYTALYIEYVGPYTP